jgi:hypothetical protein
MQLRRVFSQFNPDRVAKAVHLIRDPFDNVVSRFHLDREKISKPGGADDDHNHNLLRQKNKKNYAMSASGFREYCEVVDSRNSCFYKRIF